MGQWQACCLLGGRENLWDRCRLLRSRRQRSSWGDWRVLRWLSTSLCFLAVTINILISRSIQVERPKLNCSPIHLTVARHPNRFLLVKYATLVA